MRTVNLLSVLHDELENYWMRLDPASDALVFGTATGRRQGAENIRRRVLARAVALANEQLAEEKAEPLPEGRTPHSLRRTFASLLFVVGETPPFVMQQLGHTTPLLTLALYTKAMDRRDGEPARLKALVGAVIGQHWAAAKDSARPNQTWRPTAEFEKALATGIARERPEQPNPPVRRQHVCRPERPSPAFGQPACRW